MEKKSIWSSRTVWFNILTLGAGLCGYLASHELLADQESFLAIMVAVQGAVNIVLRLITSKPIG
jgi:hypothetical protein